MISAGVLLHVVCLRQGHDNLTPTQHYQGSLFTEDEQRDPQEVSRVVSCCVISDQ